MIRISFFLLIYTALFAQYTNCKFKNNRYTEICETLLKQNMPVEEINIFLLSPKTTKLDERSYKLFLPSKIAKHRENEKRANNVLVKHIPKIITHIKKYSAVYDEAEVKYNVNREIIASILMKETKLGIIQPSFDAFEVFNTLVVKVKENSKRDTWLVNMGKSNLVSVISYCYKKGLQPSQCVLPSSYAGAVGIAQFMPSSFGYIDSYTNEVGDLTKMEDAILSAAKYLNQRAKFTQLIDWSKIPKMSTVESQWYDYAFNNKNASFVYSDSKMTGKKYNCFACEKEELQYLKKYAKTIMSYNNSSNYAIGVIRLAYDTHYGLTR